MSPSITQTMRAAIFAALMGAASVTAMPTVTPFACSVAYAASTGTYYDDQGLSPTAFVVPAGAQPLYNSPGAHTGFVMPAGCRSVNGQPAANSQAPQRAATSPVVVYTTFLPATSVAVKAPATANAAIPAAVVGGSGGQASAAPTFTPYACNANYASTTGTYYDQLGLQPTVYVVPAGAIALYNDPGAFTGFSVPMGCSIAQGGAQGNQQSTTVAALSGVSGGPTASTTFGAPVPANAAINLGVDLDVAVLGGLLGSIMAAVLFL